MWKCSNASQVIHFCLKVLGSEVNNDDQFAYGLFASGEFPFIQPISSCDLWQCIGGRWPDHYTATLPLEQEIPNSEQEACSKILGNANLSII